MTIRTRLRSPLSELENEGTRPLGPRALPGGNCASACLAQARSQKTSVRTILRRLEQKGYLRHEERGGAYVYKAVEPARSLAARAVRQIIDSFCKGSVEELASGMAEAKVLSNDERESLEEYVRERRRGGK